MVSTLKFSQFTSAGNLQNSNITVGYGSGNNQYYNNPWVFLPPGDTASRPSPASSYAFQLRVNTDLELYEYYNSVTLSWVQLNTDQSFIWNTISTDTNMVPNNGYFVNSSSLATLTLPIVSNVGEPISIAGINMGLFTIAQNAGQSIIISPSITTSGVGGSLTSSNSYDSINLVCCIANTQWIVIGAPQSMGLIII